jgi:hypothetical protein
MAVQAGPEGEEKEKGFSEHRILAEFSGSMVKFIWHGSRIPNRFAKNYFSGRFFDSHFQAGLSIHCHG